jgi:acid phosphatase (class A)
MRYRLASARMPRAALRAVRRASAAGIIAVVLPIALGQAQTPPAPVPEIRPGVPAGYLPPEALPDSVALLPPPPAAGSPAFARDEAFNKAGRALRDTPRWDLAAEDADLRFPQAADLFSCAVNAPITEQDTPHLYLLLRRSLADAGLAARRAKDHFTRTRPFVSNNDPVCTPALDGRLRTDWSYPSGHSSVGWAWALILTEVAPARTNAIMDRGRTFGQSRVVCNVHWQSDVLAGQFVGASTVARLHADPAFRADLEAAKEELAAVTARGPKPTRDCTAEAAAIALDPARAP